MIFHSYAELHDINDYRQKSFDRKRDFCKANTIAFTGAEQIEFELMECFERIYEQDATAPYVLLKETGDPQKSRRTPELKPRVCCDIVDDHYEIFYDWQMPVFLGRYVNLIFGKPWQDWQISLHEKDGIVYKPYEKSLYDFDAFKKYDVCRTPLEDHIRQMMMWFIGLHEFGHIRNGHLELMQKVKAKEIEIGVDTQRALELHADVTAASYMLGIVSSWQKYVGKTQIIAERNGKYPGITYCDEITMAAVAAYIALRSFLKKSRWDEWTVGLHEMDGEKHPLTELRMAIVYNIFLQGVIDLGTTPTEKMIFANSMYQTIDQLEDFFFQNHSDNEEERLYYKPTELLRTERGKEYFHRIFDSALGLNDLLKDYSESFCRLEGCWSDYDTLPERLYWSE